MNDPVYGQMPQGYPGYPPTIPSAVPPQRKKWPWFVGGAAILLLFLCCCGVAGFFVFAGKEIDDESEEEHEVVYALTGDGDVAAVSYSTDEGGNIAQETQASLPWRKELTRKGFFRTYTLTAQRDSGGEGSLTCTITVDGKELASNTSTGPYAAVVCSADSSEENE
ncbi:MAG: hypothetical protein HOQ05_01760 [Corynebacteriales bacterium]|nr:hypothetical protein [Mycobacteriales bacterium]